MAKNGPWETLFNHLVLPPLVVPTAPKSDDPKAQVKHPDYFEDDTRELNCDLIDRLDKACDFLRGASTANIWGALRSTIRKTIVINQDGIQKDVLLASLDQVRDSHVDRSWLAIHVSAQNAAILIHKDSE